MDLRQTKEWGEYLSQIGWKVEKVKDTKILIRPLPLLHHSLIKIQRPKNPLPFPEIEKIAQAKKALFVVIEPEVDKFNELDFRKNGFSLSKLSLTHTSTIQLDLEKSETEIFSSLSENARRNIRKSQKFNLEIKKIFLKDDEDNFYFDKFLTLLYNLTKLKNFYTPGREEMYKKVEALRQASVLLLAYPSNSQEPVAGVWYVFPHQRLSYLQTGITQEGYNLLANYLLVWEGVRVAQSLKLTRFDFEGIFDPRFPHERKRWKQFSEFKKRFHGEVIEYPPAWIKCYNPFFKLIYICSTLFSR